MQLSEYKHIAVIQTAFIGDVVLAFPLLQFLREQLPHGTITFVTTPAGALLAQCIPAIDTIIAYDKRKKNTGWEGIRSIAQSLQNEAVQCIIAPHRSLRTTLVAQLARAQRTIGFTRNALSRLYTHRVAYPYHMHEVERNLQLLSVFADIPPESLGEAPAVQVAIPEACNQHIDRLFAETGIDGTKPFVILAPGSVWATKRWPVEHFHAVARTLCADGVQVVLSGSNEDIPLCKKVADGTGAVSLAGATSLLETVALFAKASAVISNDSAPTHIANLVDCPVITIFGPTDPIFGFAPRGAKDKAVVQEHLACRPCAIHGQHQCPLGHFACMRGIEPARIVRMAHDIISR